MGDTRYGFFVFWDNSITFNLIITIMKIAKTLFIPGILLLAIVTGCVFTSTYSNREEDKADAEKVTHKLFEYLKSKDYDGACSLFSKEFYTVTPKDSLKGMFTMVQNDLGDLQQDSLAQW